MLAAFAPSMLYWLVVYMVKFDWLALLLVLALVALCEEVPCWPRPTMPSFGVILARCWPTTECLPFWSAAVYCFLPPAPWPLLFPMLKTISYVASFLSEPYITS